MSSTKQAPEFEIGLLLRAAAMVNLDPMDVPGDVNPWQWDDPRAKGWQSAIRVLNPTLADAAEATWGPAMTLGLRAALAGESPWTADLEKELEIRRPGLAKERRDAAVHAALEQMAENRRAEQEARAARTPTPEQARAQLIASKNEAAAAAAREYFGVS
jgi:hypothetical protein